MCVWVVEVVVVVVGFSYLHGHGELAGTERQVVPAGASVCHIKWEHQHGHHGECEARDDNDLRDPGLVPVLRMLEVDQDVEVRGNDQERDHDGDDDEKPVETFRHGVALSLSAFLLSLFASWVYTKLRPSFQLSPAA